MLNAETADQIVDGNVEKIMKVIDSGANRDEVEKRVNDVIALTCLQATREIIEDIKDSGTLKDEHQQECNQSYEIIKGLTMAAEAYVQ